jgi:hypothetical protein
MKTKTVGDSTEKPITEKIGDKTREVFDKTRDSMPNI